VIVDRITNARPLYRLPLPLQRALDYLRSDAATVAAIGRHEIDGNRMFALVQEYRTRDAADCAWEAHRKYIDVQFVAAGAERMGYAALGEVAALAEYDSERDFALYSPGTDVVTIHAGMFAIFGPGDVHSPCQAVGAPASVRKIVVKVAVDATLTDL
jgi:biofilm protein TabA